MSIPAINWCIEQAGLPPGEWVVLFHLAHCHNHETGRCDPSQEYLSSITGMGLRTVRRHLASLEAGGLIARQKRGIEGGGRVSDWYTLGHEPAKLAANVTGQSMRTNRPNGARIVHEMAGKQEVTGIEQEEPPVGPPLENGDDKPAKKPDKRRLPDDWVPSDEDIQYALSLKIHPDDIKEIADDFQVYWSEQTTASCRKSQRGWHQTWRNRCRDVAPRFKRQRYSLSNSRGMAGPSKSAEIADRAARYVASRPPVSRADWDA